MLRMGKMAAWLIPGRFASLRAASLRFGSRRAAKQTFYGACHKAITTEPPSFAICMSPALPPLCRRNAAAAPGFAIAALRRYFYLESISYWRVVAKRNAPRGVLLAARLASKLCLPDFLLGSSIYWPT